MRSDGAVARGLNKVMVIGELGRDPEMRYMPNGRPVTSFSVATTRSWTNAAGERREETEWFNVVAWGNLAEICRQRLRKGQQVYVDGRLQTRSWEDQEGRKCFRTELVANEMILLNGRRGTSSEAMEFPARSSNSRYGVRSDDFSRLGRATSD